MHSFFSYIQSGSKAQAQTPLVRFVADLLYNKLFIAVHNELERVESELYTPKRHQIINYRQNNPEKHTAREWTSIAQAEQKKSAQSNLGRGPRRCECLSRGGLITTAKVVAGEFITPQQLLPTVWAKPAHNSQGQAQSSSKNRLRCK